MPRKLYINVFDDSKENGVLGNYIFTMAFFYIIMHEFGHVLCGHEERNISSFDSIQFEQNMRGIGGYHTQAKEYMADFYGVANSLMVMLASFHENYNEMVNCVGIYLTAIQSVFWIFNFFCDNLEAKDWSETTHPHPIVRMGYFLDLVSEELAHSIDIFNRRNELKFEAKANEMFEESLMLFLNLTDSSEVRISPDEMVSEKCTYEIIKIREAVLEEKEKYREDALVNYE